MTVKHYLVLPQKGMSLADEAEYYNLQQMFTYINPNLNLLHNSRNSSTSYLNDSKNSPSVSSAFQQLNMAIMFFILPRNANEAL